MGVVYRARQVAAGRVVALKMIKPGLYAGEERRERFHREAEATARLQHPNIVQIYDVGECGGQPYFSLEFCPGGSLKRKLAGQPLPARQAARLVEMLAEAVEAAHRKGVIHRDLKPENVLVAEDGTPKVADFGLARFAEGHGHLTASEGPLGTPSYMAPEQTKGNKEITPRTDVYALGAILYECLTGRPPFLAASLPELIQLINEQEPVPPRRLNPQAPRDLDTIALKCLEKTPARRYQAAADLAADLKRWQANEPIMARPVGALERVRKWARRRPGVAGLVAIPSGLGRYQPGPGALHRSPGTLPGVQAGLPKGNPADACLPADRRGGFRGGDKATRGHPC
jgi:serine/threonine-protein kinase